MSTKFRFFFDPAELTKPGFKHLAIEHDDGCPMSDSMGNIGECTCKEVDLRLWTDAQGEAHMYKTREQRRKAERETAAAIRRAKRATK